MIDSNREYSRLPYLTGSSYDRFRASSLLPLRCLRASAPRQKGVPNGFRLISVVTEIHGANVSHTDLDKVADISACGMKQEVETGCLKYDGLEHG